MLKLAKQTKKAIINGSNRRRIVGNTADKGQVSILIVRNSKTKEYLGICYEFAIVLENKNQEVLREDLLDAAKGYVKTVQSKKLPDYLLEKQDKLPVKYKVLFEEFERRALQKEKPHKVAKEYEEAFRSGNANLSLACV